MVGLFLLENGLAIQSSTHPAHPSSWMVDWMLSLVLELGVGGLGFGSGATFSTSDLVAGCGNAHTHDIIYL